MPKIIAFAGLKGSGKDTAAKVFEDAGYEHVKMAGPLKAMLRTLLEYQGASDTEVEMMIDGVMKEMPHYRLLCGRSARHAMQTIGTEWGRDQMHPEFWTSMAENRIKSLKADVVISDIRFPNEVAMVKALGGVVFRIDRGLVSTDLHQSEAQIMDLAVDGVIDNSFGSAAEFSHSIIQRLMRADTATAALR